MGKLLLKHEARGFHRILIARGGDGFEQALRLVVKLQRLGLRLFIAHVILLCDVLFCIRALLDEAGEHLHLRRCEYRF